MFEIVALHTLAPPSVLIKMKHIALWYTRCDQNLTVILKFLESCMFDFHIFFLLCCTQDWENFNGDARPGHPTTLTTDENIEDVKKMILDNRQNTMREVPEDVGISFGSCQAIFTDALGMKRAAAKIVPKLLNFEQKQRLMDIAQEMLTTFKRC